MSEIEKPRRRGRPKGLTRKNTGTGSTLFDVSFERRPVYVHQDIDDLPLTVEAFRVYMHLSRRSGRRNKAWPSYTSIGEHCFRPTYPNVQLSSLRRKAIKAVAELENIGVIEVTRRKIQGESGRGNRSNIYRILPQDEWKPELLQWLEIERQKKQDALDMQMDMEF